MDAETSKRRRRWYQFSLRTLMIAVTILCLGGGYVTHVRAIVTERRAELDRLIALDMKGELPWFQFCPCMLPMDVDYEPYEQACASRLRMWLGDLPVGVVIFRTKPTDEELQRLTRIFPEAAIGFKEPKFRWLAGPYIERQRPADTDQATGFSDP
jgi:hypothetical protein